MIQTIINYIIMVLREAFPNIQGIYTEQVKQGLIMPCFMVKCINSTNRLFLGNRYKRRHLFNILYFPGNNLNAKEECHAVCEMLYIALEVIGIPSDLIRGTNMNAEIVDNVLVFTLDYDVFVDKVRDIDLMESLDIERIKVEGW